MSATSLYFSEGARIDHYIRAAGFFTLVNRAGDKIIVYGMGKPVPAAVCGNLNNNKSARAIALTKFLKSQVAE